ncbi:TPA: hypothetical protein ACGBRI_003718 [Escherichia coli]|nr:hypothetical protein [Escherichia coli]
MVNYRLISLALTSRSWRANWPNVATFFAYPEAIRKVIYTCMEFLREQNHLGQKRVGR